MTRLNKLLMAASTMTLISASAALAGDRNEAYEEQTGNNNTLRIEQTGSNNLAGTSQNSNGDLDAITQRGDGNQATILQSGDGNKVGTSNNGSVIQEGDDNLYFIKQASDGNRVGLVRQLSDHDGNTSIENRLVVRQRFGDDNGVGTIIQRNDGGAQNKMFIYQDETGNDVVDARQNGTDNEMRIDQTGTNNRVFHSRQGETSGTVVISNGNLLEITQNGTSNLLNLAEQSGDDNSAKLSFDGDRNGRNALSGDALNAANRGGVGDAQVRQVGSGNMIDLMISGNENGFAIAQDGTDNTVGTLTITGSLNELGISQMGEMNKIAMSDIAGSENNIGLVQDGFDNSIDLTLSAMSDKNMVNIHQESNARGNIALASIDGSMNDLTISQTVGNSANASSVAEISITGDSNFLNVDQNSTRQRGGAQTVLIDIEGDYNNNTGGGFTGDAASVGLTPGFVTQDGNGNLIDVDVFGDSNLFAFDQSGNPGGTIKGMIDGDSNQVAIRQTGTANVQNFQQVGSGNNLAVVQ